MKGELTGKYYYKPTIFGLILMVEYYRTVADFPGDESPDRKVWRRAKLEDLPYIKYKA